ncbi:gephyrin-like molybdotransferase Glp [Ornithinibacillus sp. 4-3]|uniref:Molybdopterin molybdenumtransferase n=1 Tax=Ornithinibacillus sp. 4-3 TaxID=3231488 RepID=A0AB39HTY4_9BACI
MVEIRKPIPVNRAIEKVMKHKKNGEIETISFHECDYRRLAEPIIADNPIPAFDKSPYDGFALRAEDTLFASPDNPIEFEVIDHIGAGIVSDKTLEKGQAVRIMTGAEIPKGADCVAMFEVCQQWEDADKKYMAITSKFEPGTNIIEKGSEVVAGQVLVEAGVLIDAGVKALLATFGYAEVKVAKQPVIGVIATGTELLDVHEALEPGKIRNSNAYMVCSQILRSGAKYQYLGKLADDFQTGYDTIKVALNKVDVLITTGGVSVGDFDLMPAILKELGAEILFNKIAMRPGSVTTVAVIDNKFLFCLSGNPSACYVGFELFTRPIIQTLLYNKRPYLKRIKATFVDDLPKANPFTRFVRTYIAYEEGKVCAKLAGMDKSNVVSSLAHTNALMMLPGGTSGYTSGDKVEVLLLNDMEGQEVF